MSGIFNAATNATLFATAAAAEQNRQREDEEMTSYSADELAGNWEFKIIRSGTRIFRNREKLREILEEEAGAGWELLEKLDDQRVRLKRPVSARKNDHRLDIDPYRTTVGTNQTGLAVVALLLGLVTAALIGFIALRGPLKPGNRGKPVPPAAGPEIVVVKEPAPGPVPPRIRPKP